MELISPGIGLFIWTILNLVTIILLFISLFSILRNEFHDSKIKLSWIIGVIFLPIIGPILYLKKRKKLFK
jgi:ABC-type multidrug transport system permease subunit